MWEQVSDTKRCMVRLKHLTLALILAPIAVLETDQVLFALPICQAPGQLHLHGKSYSSPLPDGSAWWMTLAVGDHAPQVKYSTWQFLARHSPVFTKSAACACPEKDTSA